MWGSRKTGISLCLDTVYGSDYYVLSCISFAVQIHDIYIYHIREPEYLTYLTVLLHSFVLFFISIYGNEHGLELFESASVGLSVLDYVHTIRAFDLKRR